MRIARSGDFRRKIIEISTKIAMIFITGLFCLWMISGAKADAVKILDIKHSMHSGVREVAIQLSEAIPQNQISLEHQRNFIQISLHGASAYPAQTTNIADGLLDKVFTYQYQPDLARARILLNTESEQFKNNTSWSLNGKSLVVKFGTPIEDKVVTKKAAPEKDTSREADDRIVKEILAKKSVAPKVEAAPIVAAASVANIEDEPVFSQKVVNGKAEKPAHNTTQSAARVVSALLTVLLLMAGAFLGYRKLRNGRIGKNSGSDRAMETIMNHSLGAKRSLSLVKIAGKYYVLGVTDHNISVITSFDKQDEIEKYIDEVTTGGGFDSILSGKLNIFSKKEQAENAWDEELQEAPRPVERRSVRAEIKKRIEGFKPLY